MPTFNELQGLSAEDRALHVELEKLAIENARLELERTQMRLENAKVQSERTKAEAEKTKSEVEQAKVKLESEKARWNVVAALSPLLVAVATVAFGVINQRSILKEQRDEHVAQLQSQADIQKMQTTQKIAEWLVANSSGPQEVGARAKALGDLFPTLLSPALVKRIGDHPYEFRDSTVDAKLKFFDVLRAAKGEAQERLLVKAWSNLFPCDEWLPSFGIHVPKECGLVDLSGDTIVGTNATDDRAVNNHPQ
jgi:hypothetical protein